MFTITSSTQSKVKLMLYNAHCPKKIQFINSGIGFTNLGKMESCLNFGSKKVTQISTFRKAAV